MRMADGSSNRGQLARRSGLAFAIGLLAVSAAAAAPPRRALDARLRERTQIRESDGRLKGTSVLRLTLRSERDLTPGALTLRVGDVGLTVGLDRGRHRGRVPFSDLRLNVRARRGHVRVVLRAARGAVFGDRAAGATDARVGGPLYALESASIRLDDDPEIEFAVAAYGRADLRELSHGRTRAEVRLRADAVLPGDTAAAPRVRAIGGRDASVWRGRLHGHALAQGDAPLLTWREGDAVHSLITPRDGAAIDVGSGARRDVRRVGDGVVALDLPAGTVVQSRFDFAIALLPGDHALRLRVVDETGLAGRASRSITVGEPHTPVLLDGGLHVLETRDDGSLWAWGGNDAGQVGDGTVRDPISPVPLDGPRGVVAVAAGSDFSLAVDEDGHVWQWGERESEPRPGVFVVKSIGSRTPLLEPGLSDIVAVAAGEDHALALDVDGVVFAWGDNTFGQLGDGTTKSRARRKEVVTGLPGITAIAATDFGSLALDAAGQVWTWGDAGLAEPLDPTVAERASGLPFIKQLDARGNPLCLAADGSVWTWGDNSDGLLGDGTTLDRPFPGLVLGLSSIVQVAAGDFHALALRADGTVLAWGDNESGELGDGTTSARRVPVIVEELDGVTRIDAGTFSSLAVTSDGALWTWGTDAFEIGPLGGGTYPQLAPREFRPGHRPNADVGFFKR